MLTGTKKPPYLNRVMPLKQALIHQWRPLLKYLPLIIGNKVPDGDEHYKFLLHLSELVDLAFAPSVAFGSRAYIKFIKDRLTMFCGFVCLLTEWLWSPSIIFLFIYLRLLSRVAPLLPEVWAEEFVFQEDITWIGFWKVESSWNFVLAIGIDMRVLVSCQSWANFCIL